MLLEPVQHGLSDHVPNYRQLPAGELLQFSYVHFCTVFGLSILDVRQSMLSIVEAEGLHWL